MERHFEQDLAELRADIVRMGHLVDEQLAGACRALFTGDTALAEVVMERDTEVDRYDNLIDERCQKYFALTAPVAADLRFLMAALMIDAQLERMGDIAVNIAERVAPLVGQQDVLANTRVEEMTSAALTMARECLDSFIRGDAVLAQRVVEADALVDAIDRDIMERVIGLMQENSRFVVPGVHILMLARHIERLADHATNIAEDVIFLVEARIVRHSWRGGDQHHSVV
jgi:phosphate transport system protein